MLPPTFFNKILVFPAINILLVFYFVLNFAKIPYSFGFSLVFLTIFIRLIMQPFFHKQTKMAKQMEFLKPQLDALTKKHKEDPKKLQEEQLKLYKDLGINPASGCFIALLQMPIFIALYNVLNLFLNSNGGEAKVITAVNKIIYFDFLKITSKIDPSFLGLNLAVAPNNYGKFGLIYLLVPVITALLQYYQIELSTPKSKEEPKNTSDKKTESEDMQKAMGTQMKVMMPLMIGYFSYTLPVGLSLYWNIFSIFTIFQYKNWFGLGVKSIEKK